jgi:hypothetical protein
MNESSHKNIELREENNGFCVSVLLTLVINEVKIGWVELGRIGLTFKKDRLIIRSDRIRSSQFKC